MKTAARTVAVIMGGAGLAWAGRTTWTAYEHWGTPNCSWPVVVRGTVTPAQDGLVRCYLQALANRDTAGLRAVAADIPPVRITKADLTYSADARAGLATATFTPNPEDPTSAFVLITFAHGAQEDLGMTNMVAMGGPSGWRMDIGSTTGPSGPPPSGPPSTRPSGRGLSH
jgi:hypothetical protein